MREITGGALQRLSDVKLILDHSKTRLWATWPTRGLTGIDSPCLPAVGVRAEVRAKKPATSSPCGHSRWRGLYCILRVDTEVCQ